MPSKSANQPRLRKVTSEVAQRPVHRLVEVRAKTSTWTMRPHLSRDSICIHNVFADLDTQTGPIVHIEVASAQIDRFEQQVVD